MKQKGIKSISSLEGNIREIWKQSLNDSNCKERFGMHKIWDN